MFRPLVGLAAKYKNSSAWGVSCSVGIHVVRYQGGDYIAQTQEDHQFDLWRSIAFGCFGAYCGSVFFVMYGPIYSAILQRGVHPLGVVFIDYAVTSQILYFPAYYMLQEYIRSPTPSWERAWADCNDNRLDDFKALCTIYLPFSWFNYAKVPPAWRGTFSGCAGLIWAVYLSYSRGVRDDVKSPAVSIEPSPELCRSLAVE